MMKKFLIFVLVMLCNPVHADQIVNVEYIHELVKRRYGFEITCNAPNPKVAANMKYLLTMVDVVNERINGIKTSAYGDDTQFATQQAADTVVTKDAFDKLVRGMKEPFCFYPATTTSRGYTVTVGAAGTFYIDWGDGDTETFLRKETGNYPKSHTYKNGGASDYKICITADITAYGSNSAITFANSYKVSQIEGGGWGACSRHCPMVPPNPVSKRHSRAILN